MPDTPPQVSVIVVINNSLPALTGCLDVIEDAAAGLSWELVVVDNNSSDEGGRVVSRRFAESTVVTNTRNRGFAAACNQGAEVARGQFFLFLNPDVQLDPGAIGHLYQTARREPQAGLVSGRMRNPDGSFQATCRQFPTIANMIFSRGSVFTRLIGSGLAKERYTLADYSETATVPAVAATAVLISRELFLGRRGFDERFFMYMEDTDLSYRLHLDGYRNLFVPAAGGVHRWGSGSDAGRVKRLRQHHVSVWKYFLRHHPNGFSVLLLPLILVVNLGLQLLMPTRSGGDPA